MINSSVIKILRTFNQDEIKKFRDFIISPYHNKKSGAVKLFDVLKAFAPQFNDTGLDRKEIWKVIFPGQVFNYGKMKNIIYDLTRLAERFLISESSQSNILMNENILTNSFLDRNLIELAEPMFSSFEKKSEKISFEKNLIRENYYYYLWKNYSSEWNFENQFKHSKDYKRLIDQSSDNFLAFFFINAFIMFHNIEAQKIEHNHESSENSLEKFLLKAHSSGIISDVINSVNPLSADTGKVLNVYYKMFISVLNKNSAESYFDFKKCVSENIRLFSKRDLLALYITLLNCIVYLDTKNISKPEESLIIYETMFDNKLFFLDNDSMWDQDFLSYVTLACNLGRPDLIEKFIKKVTGLIREDKRENMLLFAKAHLYFTKGEFGKSLEYIAKTNTDLFQMKYYIKNLQIRIYYEQNDYESFLLAKDSYSHFLDKNRNVSIRWKKAMKSLCSNVALMFKLKENFDSFEFFKLKEKILSSQTNNRNWIGRKVIEFEKIHKL